jgi:two-component system response regulator AtoC
MGERIAVLHVGTDLRLRSDLRRAIECFPGTVEVATGASAAVAFLQFRREITAVVMEVEDSAPACLQALREIRSAGPDVPVILAGADSTPSLIVTVLKNGATDYICLPATPEEWRRAIAGASGSPGKESAAARLPNPAPGSGATLRKSAGMAALEAVLGQVAWSDEPVLIQGETGSGKEVIARELHAKSRRSRKPFIKLNCAALPSELVESELFGYERGAFTGAFQRKPGMFEAADGGTIMLDEIGDMDFRLQAKLLQVLQDHAFQRIGGSETIKVDVRVIAATHRDLEKSIADASFREDLYYRLNVVNLIVPPLRERKDDLFDLFDVLQRKHLKPGQEMPSVSPELRAAMLEWHWPGNVRELENLARKLLIFGDSSYILRDLRERIARRPHPAVSAIPNDSAAYTGMAAAAGLSAGGGLSASAPQSPASRIPILAEVNLARDRAEAETILAALNSAHWNRKAAAAILNVDYKGLLYRMKKLRLEQSEPAPAQPPLRSAAAGAGGFDTWPA